MSVAQNRTHCGIKIKFISDIVNFIRCEVWCSHTDMDSKVRTLGKLHSLEVHFCPNRGNLIHRISAKIRYPITVAAGPCSAFHRTVNHWQIQFTLCRAAICGGPCFNRINTIINRYILRRNFYSVMIIDLNPVLFQDRPLHNRGAAICRGSVQITSIHQSISGKRQDIQNSCFGYFIC